MFQDSQNSLNQFEETPQSHIGQNPYSVNNQEDDDDLPLMEDLGIGNFNIFLRFLSNFVWNDFNFILNQLFKFKYRYRELFLNNRYWMC